MKYINLLVFALMQLNAVNSLNKTRTVEFNGLTIKEVLIKGYVGGVPLIDAKEMKSNCADLVVFSIFNPDKVGFAIYNRTSNSLALSSECYLFQEFTDSFKLIRDPSVKVKEVYGNSSAALKEIHDELNNLRPVIVRNYEILPGGFKGRAFLEIDFKLSDYYVLMDAEGNWLATVNNPKKLIYIYVSAYVKLNNYETKHEDFTIKEAKNINVNFLMKDLNGHWQTIN